MSRMLSPVRIRFRAIARCAFLTAFILTNLLHGSGLYAQSPVFSISLQTIDGNDVVLNDLKGTKLTVLDFWATWCKPCVKSIPKLVEMSKDYESKKVQFLGINEDSPRNVAKVRPFANSLGIPYPVLLDTEQELLNELLVTTFPTLIIVDSSGRVLYTHEGYSPGDEVALKEKLDELLLDDEK